MRMGSPNTGGKQDSGDDSSSDGLPDSNPSPYVEGEKVLAYHGPRIYEAKVQKVESRKNECRYFVHYTGWNKNWDEWVGTDRMLKYTEENIQKQKALAKKTVTNKNPKSGRSTQTKPKAHTVAEAKVEKEDTKNTVGKGKKRKADSVVEKESASVEKNFKISPPSALRKQLVDDWEFVTQQDKLVKLPRSPNVDSILAKYLEYKSKKDGIMTDSIAEISNGIRSYFDKALPSMLLYKKERQQYREAVKDQVSPSTIYGAEHLLRLFVKLPDLLGCVNIEEDTAMNLQQKLIDFLKFLQRNQGAFFLSAYGGAGGAESTSKGKVN